MRLIQAFLLLSAAFLSQSLFAQGPSERSVVGQLLARVEALENGNPSVEGRTYCVLHERLIMRAGGITPVGSEIPEQLQSEVIKSYVTFSGGSYIPTLVSRSSNYMVAGRREILTNTSSTPDIQGTYSQSANRIAMTLVPSVGDPAHITWYASKDGSTVHGQNQLKLDFDLPPPLSGTYHFGITNTWQLTEGACD